MGNKSCHMIQANVKNDFPDCQSLFAYSMQRTLIRSGMRLSHTYFTSKENQHEITSFRK